MSGNTAEVAQSTVNNLAVEQCIVNTLTSVQFPAPTADRIKFRFPFFFGPTAVR